MQSMNHGLPLSNAAQRKAVALLLADPQWSWCSADAIFRHGQVRLLPVCIMR
jgi:hypothetical protein